MKAGWINVAIRRSAHAKHSTEVLQVVRKLRFLKTIMKTSRFSTVATGQVIPFMMHVIKVTVWDVAFGV